MDIPVEVLVVEGREPAREIILLAFTRKGADIHVYVTEHEAEAVAVLEQRVLPCVLMLGYVERTLRERLLRHVKSASGVLRRVPVVTWVRTPDEAQYAYDLGSNSCLAMPEDHEQLAAMMTDVAQYWVRYNIFYNDSHH